jgi:hypothetical protein
VEEDAHRAAGALIIAEIETFDRSQAYFEREVRPEIWRALTSFFEDWKECHLLVGGTENIDYYYFFALPSWHIGESDYYAWFHFRQEDGSASSDIADLCGVGSGRVSIRFIMEPKHFGGRKVLTQYRRQAEYSALAAEISAIGFTPDPTGEFFAQIIIPGDKLASAWREGDCQLAFDPIAHTLSTIITHIDVFDRMVSAAKNANAG